MASALETFLDAARTAGDSKLQLPMRSLRAMVAAYALPKEAQTDKKWRSGGNSRFVDHIKNCCVIRQRLFGVRKKRRPRLQLPSVLASSHHRFNFSTRQKQPPPTLSCRLVGRAYMSHADCKSTENHQSGSSAGRKPTQPPQARSCPIQTGRQNADIFPLPPERSPLPWRRLNPWVAVPHPVGLPRI